MKLILLLASCCVLNAQPTITIAPDFQALTGQPRVIQIYRQPPLPYPYDKSWAVSVYWDKDGNHYTDASISIVGRHEDTPDAHGHYPIRRPLPNYMFSIWSDVDAPSFVHRGNNLSNSCFLVNLDPITGTENLRVTNDGSIKANSIEVKDGVDGEFRMGRYKVTMRGGIILKVERMPVSQRFKSMLLQWKQTR